MAVVLATFVLLLAGGNVTTKNAGLSVPDWPLSFGSVNPHGWTENQVGGHATPGVRDEHGHRLIGATVGMLVTVLAIGLAARDPRRWMKWLGLAAFLAVVVQGVMGGLRVTEKSLVLAIVHGCFAQMFFCLVIAMAAFTSPRWPATVALGQQHATNGEARALRWTTGGLVAAILLQLVLGALLRHTGMTWIPHLSWAIMVGLMMMAAARYVFACPVGKERLSGPMIALLILYMGQVVLGLATLIVVYPMWTQGYAEPRTFTQDWLPTVHLAAGAAILGIAAHLAVHAFALTSRASAEPVPSDDAVEGAMS